MIIKGDVLGVIQSKAYLNSSSYDDVHETFSQKIMKNVSRLKISKRSLFNYLRMSEKGCTGGRGSEGIFRGESHSSTESPESFLTSKGRQNACKPLILKCKKRKERKMLKFVFPLISMLNSIKDFKTNV